MGEGRGGETMWLDKKEISYVFCTTIGKHENCVCLRKWPEIKISDKRTLATLQLVIICTWN